MIKIQQYVNFQITEHKAFRDMIRKSISLRNRLPLIAVF